jgi:hypothetical protein
VIKIAIIALALLAGCSHGPKHGGTYTSGCLTTGSKAVDHIPSYKCPESHW